MNLFNVLPQDNHDSFASLTDDQKKAMLPADTLAEYQKDGKPATEQDPKERIDAQKNYVRQLRSTALSNNARQQNTILFDESEATTRTWHSSRPVRTTPSGRCSLRRI